MKRFVFRAATAVLSLGTVLVAFGWMAAFSSTEQAPTTPAADPVSSDPGDTFGFHVTDARYRPGCERSGGTWYEKKGRDLPALFCVCPYNDWRQANLDKVVSSGCECNPGNSCFGQDAAFPPFDFAGESRKPRPPRPSTRTVIRTDLSRCSFQATIDNRCAECREDADCGGRSSGGSDHWIRHSTVSICDAGRCRFKRTIYYE